ncbi:MAG TPA: hypothetical protein VFH48_12050 [Chloroflexota bacterium]|nr:hypothetical protein [Chloroflexota bacterium]
MAQRWEYCSVNFQDGRIYFETAQRRWHEDARDWTGETGQESVMGKLSAQGWELVAVSHRDSFYFKRALDE